MFKAAERDDASDPLVEAAKDAVRWHDEVRDVQARQQLVVERACRLAESAGFDWILHVDADELLYFPDAACRSLMLAAPAVIPPNDDSDDSDENDQDDGNATTTGDSDNRDGKRQ